MDTRNESGDGELTNLEKQIIKKRLDEKDELRDAAGVVGDRAKGQGGVLNKLVTISEEARQILAGANFRDDLEADIVEAALAEARRYGCNDGLIMDYISAHCGVSSQRKSKTEWGVHAITHLDINQPSQNKLSWRGQKKEEKPQG